jgi:hypothetical protein
MWIANSCCGITQHQDENLDVLDQCILLSLCLDVKNNNPRHGLTTEEMFPYVRRVQKNPNNWMVHSTCLLLKSRLEFESTKTADRAVLQMQVRLPTRATYLSPFFVC